MAIVTLQNQRIRTELKTFSEAAIIDLEAAYNAYEAGKAADNTKSWTVRVVNAYHDGVNHLLIAEASYPERNDDPLGTAPPGGLP